MSQSTVIAGTVIIAFIMYVTLRGQLPKYLAALALWDTKDGGNDKAPSNFAESMARILGRG